MSGEEGKGGKGENEGGESMDEGGEEMKGQLISFDVEEKNERTDEAGKESQYNLSPFPLWLKKSFQYNF